MEKTNAKLASRRLLVMRHAKSDWDTGVGGDFDRPLAKRGRRDAPRMGRWLLEQRLVPDWIISSPALRARETTLAVCEALGLDDESISWDRAVYAAEVPALLAVLARCPAERNLVLLVGHNPGLEELVEYLARGSGTLPRSPKLLPTAAVACLELPADWSRLKAGAGRIFELVIPKNLP